MTKEKSGNGKVLHRQSFATKLILIPFGFLYRIWTFSIRMHYRTNDEEKELLEYDQPLIVTLWHNRLFLAGEWHLRFRRKRLCYGLISGSKDGSWLETFYGWAGIKAVRGSRNRRAVQAVRDLIKILKSGHDVGITPDGSRGPPYKAKSGVIALAKVSKYPILLLSFKYNSCFRINSWDRFILPLPFSRVEVSSQLIFHKDLLACQGVEEATRLVETKLNQMSSD